MHAFRYIQLAGRLTGSPIVFGAAHGEAEDVSEHGRQVPRLGHRRDEGGKVARVELPETCVGVGVEAADDVVHQLLARLYQHGSLGTVHLTKQTETTVKKQS